MLSIKISLIMSIVFTQGINDLLVDLDDKTDENIILAIKNKLKELFDMKNIHFLFGSGTSADAIPTMGTLFDNIKATIDGKPNAEDIKLEFNNIIKRVEGKNLEEILGILYSHRSYLKNKEDAAQALTICITLIETVESEIFHQINIDLSNAKSKTAFELYQKFYRKIALRNKDLSRINIFTTNNDLFNEKALDSLNIHYINGFSGGLNKFFNPALFNYTFSKRMDTSIDKFEPVENMVNLYKVHGSVNWIEDNSNDNTFFKIKEISTPKFEDENVLIYPTPTKQNKSLGSPYVEMFREFQKKLMEPLSVLFVIGYSFSDEHVNNVIYQALATNSTMNLVIINDISDKDLFKVEDDRIFKIYGTKTEDPKSKIHYFENIVNLLLPNVNAFKPSEKSLNEFLKFYKETTSK